LHSITQHTTSYYTQMPQNQTSSYPEATTVH
jgi:hypothetical protein